MWKKIQWLQKRSPGWSCRNAIISRCVCFFETAQLENVKASLEPDYLYRGKLNVAKNKVRKLEANKKQNRRKQNVVFFFCYFPMWTSDSTQIKPGKNAYLFVVFKGPVKLYNTLKFFNSWFWFPPCWKVGRLWLNQWTLWNWKFSASVHVNCNLSPGARYSQIFLYVVCWVLVRKKPRAEKRLL